MVTFYCALALGQKCDFSQNLVKVGFIVYEVNKMQVRAFENFSLNEFSSEEQNSEDQSFYIFLKVLLSRKHVRNGTMIFSQFLHIYFSSWSPVKMFCMTIFPGKLHGLALCLQPSTQTGASWVVSSRKTKTETFLYFSRLAEENKVATRWP